MIEGQTRTGRARPGRDIARSQVLHRPGMVFCPSSQAELRGVIVARQGRGSGRKVLYPTREFAEAAARELESLGAVTSGTAAGPAPGTSTSRRTQTRVYCTSAFPSSAGRCRQLGATRGSARGMWSSQRSRGL